MNEPKWLGIDALALAFGKKDAEKTVCWCLYVLSQLLP